MAASPSRVLSEKPAVPAARRAAVLIADETRMGCELLKDALERSRHGFDVIASAVDRPAVIQAMNEHNVSIALINENLQDGPFTGFELLRELRIYFPQTRSIMLLKSASRELVLDAFRGGAKGVFCRAQPVEALCKCIQVVHRGQIWAGSRELEFLLEALVNAAPLRVVSSKGLSLLGRREDEVALLVADGLTNREVAQKLGLSEHTVSNYLFRIYNKLGISSRVELVLYIIGARHST